MQMQIDNIYGGGYVNMLPSLNSKLRFGVWLKKLFSMKSCAGG